jgi:hypothetical protein
MHQQIATQRSRSIVVDAARAVRHIAHNERLDARAELRHNVRNGRRKQEQAFGHLQRYFARPGLSDSVYCLWYFEVVVGWQQRYGFLEAGVF